MYYRYNATAPKIIHDRRIGLREVMLQSSIHDWDYEKTVTTLIKVNSGLPENDQTVTMAAVSYHRNNNSNNTSQYKSTSTSAPTIKSPKYCFLWNETGTCMLYAWDWQQVGCQEEKKRKSNKLVTLREATSWSLHSVDRGGFRMKRLKGIYT
jgi:hypothetical protein